MTPPIVLKSTDNEAPIMSGECDVTRFFDAVLVNGYGEKPGLGWTKEYSDPNPEKGSVYRSDSVEGNGFFYRFKRSLETQPYLVVDAYEAMSDYETGVCHFGIDSASPTQWLTGSSTKNPTPRPWMIIGDKFGFYIVCQHNQLSVEFDPAKGAIGVGIVVYYFGDYPSLIPGDVHNSICVPAMAIQGYSYMGNFGALVSPHSAGKFIPASSKGDEAHKRQGFFSSSAFSSQSYMGGKTVWNGEPGLIENANCISRVFMSDGTLIASLRGCMPGLYCPITETPYESFTSIVIPHEPDLQLFAATDVSGTYGYPGQFLFDFGDGFR